MISVVESQPAGSSLDLLKQVEQIFSPQGILSRASNFEFRPQQQQMAVAVAQALENRGHLAVEAGTGVGKSLAYLVPAILFAVPNKKKAVISTNTINLQEQLIQKEDRKSTRLNSSHRTISYAVFCLKKKKKEKQDEQNNLKQQTTT